MPSLSIHQHRSSQEPNSTSCADRLLGFMPVPVPADLNVKALNAWTEAELRHRFSKIERKLDVITSQLRAPACDGTHSRVNDWDAESVASTAVLEHEDIVFEPIGVHRRKPQYQDGWSNSVTKVATIIDGSPPRKRSNTGVTDASTACSMAREQTASTDAPSNSNDGQSPTLGAVQFRGSADSSMPERCDSQPRSVQFKTEGSMETMKDTTADTFSFRLQQQRVTDANNNNNMLSRRGATSHLSMIGAPSGPFTMSHQDSQKSTTSKSEDQEITAATSSQNTGPNWFAKSFILKAFGTSEDAKEGVVSLGRISSIQRAIALRKERAVEESPLTTRQRVYQFLENPYTGRAAYLYSCCMPIFNIASIVAGGMQTIPGSYTWMSCLVFESMFALELVARFYSCHDRCDFFYKDTRNFIDILSTLPLVARVAVRAAIDEVSYAAHEEDFLTSLAVVPALRLLRLSRSFEQFQLLIGAFKQASEALPVLIYTQIVLVFLFSSLIYVIEPRDSIHTFADALWMTIVTMTTVGYGDVVPASTQGHFVVCLLMGVSALYMAMPIGIVGSAFSEVWSDRDRLMFMKRIRQAFLAGGFSFSGIEDVLELFDTDQSGDIELPEFILLLQAMQITLPPERVAQIFADLDPEEAGALEIAKLAERLDPHRRNEGDVNFSGQSRARARRSARRGSQWAMD